MPRGLRGDAAGSCAAGRPGVNNPMSTLTVELPEEDLQFLKTWTQAKGTSVEAWVAHQAKHLREATGRRLHPHVEAATGILPDDGRDYREYREEYLEYLEAKHR